MDETILQAITDGFTTLADMIKQVVLIGVPASIGIVGLTAGAKYGIKWIQGLVNHAS